MCVWQSINPGRTVARDRAMTAAPGVIADMPASETLSILSPRTTITWSRRGALAFPSIKTPARMTVTGCAEATAVHARKAAIETARFIQLLKIEKIDGLKIRR